MNNYTIGFCLTGSFCTIPDVIPYIEDLVQSGYNVIPVLSEITAATDTRFGTAEDLINRLTQICKRPPVCTVKEAEPFGPKKTCDIVVVAPCTGNTLAKIAAAITDTSVTMAVKAHLRNQRPVVLAVSSNDSLAANAKNIGELLNRKNIYFVPFSQDDCKNKPTSVIADFSLIKDTIEHAMQGIQIQPIIKGE